MNLTLIDQLTLLALDDHKGNFIPDSTTFSYALAGALILELILEEKISVSDDYIKVIDKNSIKELADLIEKENEFKFEIYQ